MTDPDTPDEPEREIVELQPAEPERPLWPVDDAPLPPMGILTGRTQTNLLRENRHIE